LRSSIPLIGGLIVEDRARIMEDRTILGVSLDQILEHAQQAHHQRHAEQQQQQDGNEDNHGRLRDCRCIVASRGLMILLREPLVSV
jgi:hypothetical protein